MNLDDDDLAILRAVFDWQCKVSAAMDLIALVHEVGERFSPGPVSARAEIEHRLWMMSRHGLILRPENGLWAPDVALTEAGDEVVRTGMVSA